MKTKAASFKVKNI